MSNTEILAGILLVACLILFYCNNKYEYMKGHPLPELYMNEGFYSDLPKHGSFQENYTTYSADQQPMSYTTRSSNFSEPMSNNKSLHDRETVPTSAALTVQQPSENENNMRWVPDADISLNVYANDSYKNNKNSDNELSDVYYKRSRQDNTDNNSVTGTFLKYVDYGQSNKNITT